MNTAESNMENLLRLFELFRGSGTSTAIKQFAENNDVFVLCPSQDIAKNFKGGISLSDLTYGKLDGVDKKPILVDNSLMLMLLKAALTNTSKLKDVVNNHLQRRWHQSYL